MIGIDETAVYDKKGDSEPSDYGFNSRLMAAFNSETFSSCYNCNTCTGVCPVVALYDDPVKQLGLVPHQIMYSLFLGLRCEILQSRMLWYCTTCYQCQEGCPQGVKITDILYELKNIAVDSKRNPKGEKASTGQQPVSSDTV